ncbi:MAG TPA: radical SAM family heme chaperone HemW [Clostridia bacterium]|nr:radical SAM family heme chaperone HemW [Clostridia bacterium]
MTDGYRYPELPIYVHIPFCRRKCGYCDFYSLSSIDVQLQEQVIHNVLVQLEVLLNTLQPMRVPSVYIGGGTPNSLAPQLFKKLISGIDALTIPFRKESLGFNPTFEWTVELNPELITSEQISFLKESGVNRISVGIQSFSEEALKVIERNAGLDETLTGLALVTKHWKERWNLDIITGLPQQTAAGAQRDIETAIGYEPTHISLYALTIEEHTPLEKRVQAGRFSPQTADNTAEILTLLWSILKLHGFEHYEVSNFARPKQESRHNLYYWRMKPYAGIGPGAVSTLRNSRGFPSRGQVPQDIKRFAQSSTPFTELTWEELLPSQFMLEYLMMGLRTIPGIDTAVFRRIFGLDICKTLSETIRQQTALGRLRIHEVEGKTYLSVTEAGMMLLDHILIQAAREIEDIEPDLKWPLSF